MRRRLASLLTVVVVGAVAPVVAAAGPASAAGGYCAKGSGVTVVVDDGALGGGTSMGCDPQGANTAGSTVVPRAGFPLTYVQKQPGFVCRVNGAPASASCGNTPPADAYWGLFWSDGKSGSWTYSSVGIGSLKVPAGGFIGWRWQNSNSRANPGTAPVSPVAASPRPTPKPAPKPRAEAGPGRRRTERGPAVAVRERRRRAGRLRDERSRWPGASATGVGPGEGHEGGPREGREEGAQAGPDEGEGLGQCVGQRLRLVLGCGERQRRSVVLGGDHPDRRRAGDERLRPDAAGRRRRSAGAAPRGGRPAALGAAEGVSDPSRVTSTRWRGGCGRSASRPRRPAPPTPGCWCCSR